MTAQLDVLDEDSIASCLDSVHRRFGAISNVVNVASHNAPGGAYGVSLLETDLGEVLNTFAVDCVGSLRLLQHSVPIMKTSPTGGRIVLFSSASALSHDPDLLTYLGAKVSVSAYTKALARELAPKIRINSIAPGALDSSWLHRWNLADHDVQQLIAQTPMARLGDVNEIADLVAFLLSDDSAYLTGQTLIVDGGLFSP